MANNGRAKSVAGWQVALLYNMKDHVSVGTDAPPDALAEYDSEETLQALAAAIRGKGHHVIMLEADETLPDTLRQAAPDICFNLAEGLRGDSRESHAPALCEMFNIPYTGSKVLTHAISLDKVATKRIWHQFGLPTAPFQVFRLGDEPVNADLVYPLFVKPALEGSGMGINQNSIVHNENELRKQVQWVVGTYRQPALVEVFLPGREFTVGLIGNTPVAGNKQSDPLYNNRGFHVFPILEIDAQVGVGQGMYNTPAKSLRPGEEGAPLYLCPANIPESLEIELQELAMDAFESLGGLDLGRVDFRMGNDGKPYLMEINTLPGLNPIASDLCIMARTEGMPYPDLIDKVLNLAAVRYDLEPISIKKNGRLSVRNVPALTSQSTLSWKAEMTPRSNGVVVLYNASENLIKGEEQDMLAEQGVILCAEAIFDALRSAGYQVARVPIHEEVELALAPYPPDRWMIFNLGEGLSGRLFEEARIAWTLEGMGYTYTGSEGDAIARSLNKDRSKTILSAAGIETPRWRLFRHPDEVNTGHADDLCFPLIVKPVAEDASIGVDSKAVVHDVKELIERVAYVVDRYRQAALAETFIRGREFNVALWGDPPQVLPLAEIDFGYIKNPFEQIVSFAAKWQENSFEYNHTDAVCPAIVPPQMSERIIKTARKAWDAIGCQGYARVDMRVGKDGIPSVLEVNCNPDLSPDAGFFRAARQAGFNYQQMSMEILEIARRKSQIHDRTSRTNRWAINLQDFGRYRSIFNRGIGVRGRALERVPGKGRGKRIYLSGVSKQ